MSDGARTLLIWLFAVSGGVGAYGSYRGHFCGIVLSVFCAMIATTILFWPRRKGVVNG